jgi:CIC family chloride channel protein
VGGALGALAFRAGTEDIHELLTGSKADVVGSFRLMPWWSCLAVPTAGGLISGAILVVGKRFVRGQNSTDYMEAIVIGSGSVPVRASLVKTCAGLFSIGSGGSIGREGPMVQLAAMLASWLGRWRSFSPPQLRLIVACGAAAGITSAYNAPIAGAFFVAEIILGSIAMESLGPLAAASVAAAITMRVLSDVHTLYRVPPFVLKSPWEMGPYLLLGLVAGAMVPWFLGTLHKAEAFFVRLHWPLMLRMALGGLVVGALAIKVPEVCGNGYSVVLQILNGGIGWTPLILILLCKWLATAASFGSGAPGGVFTPSLFMGACLGYLFGVGVRAVAGTHLPVDPQAFAMVGMGAFLSGATRAPLMAIIMLFEMTLSYDIILPLIACSVVAYYVAKSMGRSSLYSEALDRKAAHRLTPEARAHQVSQLMKPDPPQVTVNAPFAALGKLFLSVRINHVYVTADRRQFRGVIALSDIEPYLNDPALADLILAGDILQTEFPRILPSDSLTDALSRFLELDANRMPVVDKTGILVGSLSKTDLLLALEERLRPSPP